MKNGKKALIVVFLFAASLAHGAFGSEIDWEQIGRENADLKTVLVNPENPRIIYIGTKGLVLKTEDGGKNWKRVFVARGQNNDVNSLIFGAKSMESLFAATASGLYFSSNGGASWSRVFRGKSYPENNCQVLAVTLYRIYLGSKNGIFVSEDNGRTWSRPNGEIGSSNIFSITCSLKESSCVYAASDKGVFRTLDSGRSWERIFAVGLSGADNESGYEEKREEVEEGNLLKVGSISIDPVNPMNLYLATSRGVYKSLDKGQAWQKVSDYGLLSRDVRFLSISKDRSIFALTKSGLFEYRQERWHELTSRLSAEIRFIDLDNQGNLYLACDKGLFKASAENYFSLGDNIISMYSENEPKINEIQKAAIEYAEVEPEKIMHWRNQAAKKALLPKVSAGINRDVSDLWHWESGSTTRSGDDILTRGRDTVGWDISLSWDLGELIWNDAQTSIDVRSKLMVELRGNILDEVTKLYFERIRVKMELNSLSIENRKKRYEKELKLQELTASLDALTGGNFSRQIKPGIGS